jgi:hypothetical protein
MALAVLAAELAVAAIALRSGVKELRLGGVVLAGKVFAPPMWLVATGRHLLSGAFAK